MEEIRRDGDEVVIAVARSELSALAAIVLEALDGGYAIPSDVWEDLVGVPRSEARALLDALTALLGQ